MTAVAENCADWPGATVVGPLIRSAVRLSAGGRAGGVGAGVGVVGPLSHAITTAMAEIAAETRVGKRR